jgi:NADH dehydrogenase FAD-containing subunit
MMTSKRLILLGAGHAHLLLTQHLERFRRAGIQPLLIAPRWFDYSGLATAVLSGALPQGANRIDVAALAQRRGLAFSEGKAVAIDRTARLIALADGSTHGFDLLSLNIGSVVADPARERDTWPVKPLSGLAALRAHLESQQEFPSIRIIGAGPSGTEIAAALLGLAERLGRTPDIALVGGEDGKSRAWASLRKSLKQRGLTLLHHPPPKPRHDIEIRATGLVAPPLIRAAGLADGEGTGAAVMSTLQSLVNPAIFAAGDCADFQPRSLPRQGVFGVRQAPILARNLVAAATGLPLVHYRPQRRWLAIMDLGDETGFAMWGPLALRSRLMLRWKRHLDLRFLAQFR